MTSSRPMIMSGFSERNGRIISGDGVGLARLLQAGEAWLEAHLKIVNTLNVFPVPDGDTGTNMVLTVRSAMTYVDGLETKTVETVALAAAQGALMGARGNSGVILSQFFRGLANELSKHEQFTSAELIVAFQAGTAQAYQAVVEPVEGTMLTVMQHTSTAGQQLGGSVSDLPGLFAVLVKAARQAQAETPNLLAVLMEAGVTDSGGQGFVYLLEGMSRLLSGQSLEPKGTSPDLNGAKFENFGHSDLIDAKSLGEKKMFDDSKLSDKRSKTNRTKSGIDYGYDVQFLIQGEGLDVNAIRYYIERLGNSVLVVGDEQVIKVHLHTDDPGAALTFGAKLGRIADVVIEDMQAQAMALQQKEKQPDVQRSPQREVRARTKTAVTSELDFHLDQEPAELKEGVGILAIVSGLGFANIFESLGVSRVLVGDKNFNPGTSDLLAAMDEIGTTEIILLPNNRNVIMTAQQAVALSTQMIKVIPTKTLVQGVAAMVSFNTQADFDTNVERMSKAAENVLSIELTEATHDINLEGIEVRRGNVIGMVEQKLSSTGKKYDTVILDILAQQDLIDKEILTLYFGRDVMGNEAQEVAQQLKHQYPDLQIEILNGGQPHYHYIISVE